ncbi:MAG: response regulator [Spirochaetales bacterium]
MKLKTLIIDDDPTMVTYVQTLLSETDDLAVETFTSPDDALDHIRENKVHIVILDIVLPERDGIEILKEIKAIDPLIHVIMVTIDSTFGRVLASLGHGALDFLIKPIDPTELQEVVALSKERWSRWFRVLRQTAELHDVIDERTNS